MKNKKRQKIYKESSSKKNVFLCPLFSLPNSELQQICLPLKSPVLLGRSLDLLVVLWDQLRCRSGFTPACISFQNPQLPPKSVVSS